MRYWLNEDFEKAKILVVNDETINLNLNYKNLPTGYSQISFQFKQSDGVWSSPTTDWFYKGNSELGTAGYRYWFNNDFANAITVNDAKDDLNFSISYDNAPNGYHQVNFQFKDNGGKWSSVVTDWFYKPGSGKQLVKACRYWFDNDVANMQTILLQSSTYSPLITKMDVEELSLGSHTVNLQFQDDRGVWSSVITDLINRKPITTKEYLYPKIYLSRASIQSGEKDTITGKDFAPNGEVRLRISSTSNLDGLVDTLIGADGAGKIKFIFKAASTTQSGIYSVTAYDNNNSQAAYTARLEIKGLAPFLKNQIQIIYPDVNSLQIVNKAIPVIWIDKSKTDRSLLNGITATVAYKYKIEFSKDNGPWTTCPERGRFVNGVYAGTFFINQMISEDLGYDFIPAETGIYRIKITDLLHPSFDAVSGQFSVALNDTEINNKLIWDNSTPDTSETPIGVAADGTARLILKISKAKFNIKPIVSIKLELSDSIGTSEARLLGKLKPATEIRKYSKEASDATLKKLLVQNSDPQKEDFYFWYVAPDDFTRNANDVYSGLRRVKCKIIITYSNNSIKEINNFYINIGRPPLMLVHGLAGDASTWDNFEIQYPTGDWHVLRYAKDLFRAGVKAINMRPDVCFKINASLLLNLTYPEDCDNLGTQEWYSKVQPNSFASMLKESRKLGYASNRVDYVCHSMGGSMLRTAINEYESFYKAFAEKYPYRNYDSGFVNKAITINTPHNGTPVANLGVDIAKYSYKPYVKGLLDFAYGNSEMFKSFYKPIGNIYVPTGATKDLQSYNGRIPFVQTKVRNHLIAGKVLTESCNSLLFDIALGKTNYLDFIEKIAKTLAEQELSSVSQEACDLLTLVFARYNEPDFINESDLVVPFKSQLANNTRSASSKSIFTGWSARHTFTKAYPLFPSIVSNNEVAKKTLFLLNFPIRSSAFENYIEANSAKRQTAYKISRTDSVIDYYNKSRIEIISPLSNTNAYVDSLKEIKIKIKDTVNYKFTRLFFQGETYYSYSKISDQRFNLQISPVNTGMNMLFASAIYDSSGFRIIYNDSININCLTQSCLTKFFIDPKERYLSKNQQSIPRYNGVFSNYITNISYKDTALHVSIADNSVVQFVDSLKSFKALTDTGSTYAVVTYKKFSDTMYFLLVKQIIQLLPMNPKPPQ